MKERPVIVFSGGSAWNAVVDVIPYNIVHVLPVSDDGGSTAEIIRALGGPGIGDIRSRLIRCGHSESPIKTLLGHRLPVTLEEATEEWHCILNGNHSIWIGIHQAEKDSINAFLKVFHLAIPHDSFDFRQGSIGNFFLAGCMIFFRNLESAIAHMASLLKCPPSVKVMPVIATDFVLKSKQMASPKLRRSCTIDSSKSSSKTELTQSSQLRRSMTIRTTTSVLDSRDFIIGAELRNGTLLVGQCEISHPGTIFPENTPVEIMASLATMTPVGYIPNSPDKKSSNSNLFFSKFKVNALQSPIRRVMYLSKSREEVCWPLNPNVHDRLSVSKCIIYGLGSLYTSLIPSLIVPGVGPLIASKKVPKILVLNGFPDRETPQYSGLDFILAITDALNYSCKAQLFSSSSDQIIKDFPEHATESDIEFANSTGSTTSRCVFHFHPSEEHVENMTASLDPTRTYSTQPHGPSDFISHVIYLENGSIFMPVAEIEKLGIQVIPVTASLNDESGPKYSVESLSEALKQFL